MKITTGVFLFNNKNQFLVGRVTRQKAWSIPKGEYEADSGDFLANALRELEEETDINFICDIKNKFNVTYGNKYNIDYPHGKKALVGFDIKFDGVLDKQLLCNSYVVQGDDSFPEFDKFKWIDMDSPEFKLIHSTQQTIVKKIQEIRRNELN